MRLPQLTFSKAVIITIVINVIIYRYIKVIEPFNLINKSTGHLNSASDEFSMKKSLALKDKILEKIRKDIPLKLLKQKYFVSNISIYTIKSKDSTIYTDEKSYKKNKYDSENENLLVKYIINTPTLDPKSIKIHIAPVKIELTKIVSSPESGDPVFKALLNNSTPITLTYKNLLYLSEHREIQKDWKENLIFPTKLITCPQEPHAYNKFITNKLESISSMDNVINHAPFMKKIIDMERFKAKSNKPDIFFCFWLKLSTYEDFIRSDIYLTAFAPQYSRNISK